MTDDLSLVRVEYEAAAFGANQAGSDPMERFAAWFGEAAANDDVIEANAMALATVSPGGRPSNRMVLLKRFDRSRAAFTWFTSLESRKAREALHDNVAALCWWWPGNPGRQVRAVGCVELVGRDEVDEYFAARPEPARFGAAASRQSAAVADRETLEARVSSIQLAPGEAPETWGGLRLVADEIEFWQGRSGRLHDRIVFLRLDPATGEPQAGPAVEAAGGLDAVLRAGTRVVDLHGSAWLRLRLEP